MVGPAQTLLEDLRSTNGVMVNGRRVTRAALRDGDVVHIGKTQVRYVQRVRDRG
jgi:pSer/pThr/pTyr-binding forkhead associated (FHA) protein